MLIIINLFLYYTKKYLSIVTKHRITSYFKVVCNAYVLAGSLIFDLLVVILEVSLILALMATSNVATPALMRDTIYSVIMIVITCIVGFYMLLGGKSIKFTGTKLYLLAIMPLVVIWLIFPSSLPGGNFTVSQMLIVSTISAAMYGIFILKSIYKNVFTHEDCMDQQINISYHSSILHCILLVIYLLVIITVTKWKADSLDKLLIYLNTPKQIIGFIVALLILLPEVLCAINAVLDNKVQQAMNIFFSSVLATISITVPTVTFIAVLSGKTLEFGLSLPQTVVMITTLMLCNISLTTGETNILNGTAHIALFCAYLITIML